ncbi:uncharacterized protein MEPE_03375 [Melanopsichium pennsylvanicum]|uniref:Ricin B lectin domain-containing protein n=2 Tax=Melanopsichium pennsylvanicum TaxID=63383 RepID=A0AAJ4XMK4_9BASI|nr:hypothetical protein BN887_04435 [Melanopsichium pennsylvanicum 4]SNX84666.1 uncharacterized protein MEPE_03375 [Melanopsichium pennsylvanicum]
MRFTLVTFSTLLAFGGASASVLPRMLTSAELAQPIMEEREVGVLECDAQPIYVGELKMVSSTGREVSAAFEGIRNSDGYQQLDVQKAGQSARIENFAFTQCNSTFMGYEAEANKAAEVYFGRLQPAHLVGKRCVSADELAQSDARLIAAKCESSDDSVQLLQYWSLTKQPAAEANKFVYYVNFLGQPAGDTQDFPGSYTLSQASVDSNKLVRLHHSNDAGKRSAYFLKLA